MTDKDTQTSCPCRNELMSTVSALPLRRDGNKTFKTSVCYRQTDMWVPLT
jgi:hypothetical protein